MPALDRVAGMVRSDQYVIFMSHDPSVIPDALRTYSANNSRSWFDLGLFGHTHGGQIGMFPGLLGISDVNSRYTGGWINENRIDMLISRGVGTSVLPIRIGCPPQMHIITVRRR